MKLLIYFTLMYFTPVTLHAQNPRTIWLDELDISKVTQDRSEPKRNLNTQGDPISMGGKIYQRGLGTHASSTFYIRLKGGTEKFSAIVGLDDAVRHLEGSPQEFMVIGDDKILWRSGLMGQVDYPKTCEVDLTGVDVLLLMVRHGKGKFRGEVNWANAKFEVTGDKPEAFIPKGKEPYLLTPAAGENPKINGPSVFGARPGAPFFYKIPATGKAPLTYQVENLPKGLQVNETNGVITGTTPQAGEYPVMLLVQNKKGEDSIPFTIKVGETIALTPPMGWNNWNAYGKNFDEKIIRETARAFVEHGLIDHGWTYVNMDDGWQGARGGEYNAILANEKFSDMKKITDDIHDMGLKVGIYSTPWKLSYAGYIGSSADTPDGKYPYEYNEFQSRFGVYPFYEADAKQWADWGIDYMKYDWHPNDVAHTAVMYDALKKSERDIYFSLSNSSPFSEIEELSKHANSWRTTGDIIDTWGSVYSIVQQMDRWQPYSRPGHWNDADMLVVGWLGGGHGNLHYTRLTPSEQYTHISLWAMFASPMLLGCDLTRLDEFTINLLTNNEVLAINQDPLGAGAGRVYQNELVEIWSKDLADGSKAVALCNFGLNPTEVKMDWEMLGIEGEKMLRDVWRQKDIGKYEDKFASEVPGHGVLLLMIKNN